MQAAHANQRWPLCCDAPDTQRASLSLWRFRAGWRLAGPYLLLVAAVALYVGYRLLFRPANSELVGVYLVVLGLPWSLLGAAGGVIGIGLALVAGIGLNAWLLYRLGGGRAGGTESGRRAGL